MVDIDECILMWDATPEQLEKEGVYVQCPGVVSGMGAGQLIRDPSRQVKFLPHKKHIEYVKKHSLRGHTVIAWSKGGWYWAAAAIKAVGLEDYVDLVVSKPMWTVDDQSPEEYMPKSRWMEDV